MMLFINNLSIFVSILLGSTTSKGNCIQINQSYPRNKDLKDNHWSTFTFTSRKQAIIMTSVKAMNYGKFIAGRGPVVPHAVGRGLWTWAPLGKVGGKEYLIDDTKSDAEKVSHKGERILYNLWLTNRANKEHVNYKLMSIFKHDDIWISSYKKLIGYRGSYSAGPDGRTILDLSESGVLDIKNSVINGSFKWGQTRKVFIPKPGGGKRPLGIPDIQDRLVQEVIRRVLSSIYEPIFSPYSHGFRPGRSCHTALRNVRKSFKGTKWMIEGDISKFFDTVNHDKLITLLRNKINDERLLNLIYAGCKSKIIMPDSGSITNDRGVPQGGVVYPLLANIYLHELDMLMHKFIDERNIGFQRPHNSEYRRYVRKHGYRNARKTKLKASDYTSDKYKRFSYVRYADDFIIGMCDTRQEALQVKSLIADFLSNELNLLLNQDKTLITDTTKKATKFLGYLIHIHSGVYSRNHNNTLRLTGKGHVRLMADTNKVVRRLAEKGFCTKDGDPRPKFTFLSDTQGTTNKKVNRIFRGIMEYYKLADNKKQFGCLLFYIFSHSLAKLYSAKFRWHRRATIFKLAGRDLSLPIMVKRSVIGKLTDIPIEPIIYSHYSHIPITIKAPLDPSFTASWDAVYKGTVIGPEEINDILRKNTIAGPIKDNNAVCAKCGSSKELQIHHIKRLKDVNKESI